MTQFKISRHWMMLFLCLFVFPLTLEARDLRGRLGVGMSNQLQNDIPSLSAKLQNSSVFAVGAMFGVDANDNNGGYGAGLKVYRFIYDEPMLNFYLSGLLGVVGKKDNGKSTSGFQVDGTMGAEFSFEGLESIGFSFEFGISVNNLKDEQMVFQTTGHNFITAGVHFYL